MALEEMRHTMRRPVCRMRLGCLVRQELLVPNEPPALVLMREILEAVRRICLSAHLTTHAGWLVLLRIHLSSWSGLPDFQTVYDFLLFIKVL